MQGRRRPSLKERWLGRVQSLSRPSMPAQQPAAPAQAQAPRETVSPEEARRRAAAVAEQLEAAKEAGIAALPEDYFAEDFEAGLWELQRMPPAFQVEDLDAVAEERATVLEAVSERLSRHVLANYDTFVRGIDEAASVESDLQSALQLVRGARGRLAASLTGVEADISIADRQKQRQGLGHMAAVLGKLQQAAALQAELKEAQEGGDFAACFWLCAQCCRSLESLQTLAVTGELLATVNRLYAETVHHMAAALQSICCEFEEGQYCKILEGYGFLGSSDSLGEEVTAAFTGSIAGSTLKVVRGVVLTRAGLEDRARSSTVLPEIVKWLPPDLFRQCLAKVLMVVFDILASHHRMRQWHEARLEEHRAEAGRLAELQARLAAESAERTGGADELLAAPGSPSASARPPTDGGASPEEPSPRGSSPAAPSSRAHSRRASRHALEDAMTAASFGRLQPGQEAEPDPLGDRHDGASLAQRARAEEAWGAALQQVAASLEGRRGEVWDEAARKLAMLLAAPAAFQGEHFLQVLEWTQTMLRVGEAFSGRQATSLREAAQRHSGRFFQAFHAANLQALHQMLEQEGWQPLPTPEGRLPDFRAALQGGSTGSEPAAASFAEWAAQGNPWKRQPPGSAGGGTDGADGESEASVAETREELPEAPPGSPASNSGRRGGGGGAPVTASSWRMLRWLADYAGLLRMLASDAGRVHSCCCELFELYFVHVAHVFCGVSMADLLGGAALRQGAADAIPLRLRNAVRRALTRSLASVRGHYLPQAQGDGASQAAANGNSSAAEATALSHPGNMHGLLERKVAADSLVAAAAQLQAGQARLGELLAGRGDVPEHHTPEAFGQTLKAASDLRDVVLRRAARLNLAIAWVPERLAEQRFDLAEPPVQAAPWVAALLSHARVFRQRLESARGLAPPDVELLWGFGLQYAAEVVLEGLARAGGRGRCTVMGRSAMSLDLQALQQGLQGVAGGRGAGERLGAALRLVDAYVKAFYIPWGEELHRWALTHPEYTREQVLLLVGCIADANGLKRRERNALAGQIEADLAGMR